jgi:Domain of unknown function (DUF4760)
MVAKEPIAITIINAAFANNESLRAIAHRVLNYHESLAVGVLEGVYDENTIKSIRRSAIELLFNAFKHYIDRLRVDIQPTAWSQQERLINKWKLEDNPRPTVVRSAQGANYLFQRTLSPLLNSSVNLLVPVNIRHFVSKCLMLGL